MKQVLLYLLQMVACSGILYGYYHLFLRNKKFHQYNRYFLLITVVISIIIPFLQIPVYVEGRESQPLLVRSLTVFSTAHTGEEFVITNVLPSTTWFTWKNIFSSLYVLMGLLLFTRFWISLHRVIRMTRQYPAEAVDNILFIQTDEPSTPFSFFRWLFWNSKIDLNSEQGQQILRHELFHIRQKHSWDIIFLEIATIFLWINPFFHLVRKEIKAIHEFLADKHAAAHNKEWDYAELLLMQALGAPNTRLTNPFFHNQIKRRIAMLTSSNKPGYQYLRKIMVLPLAAIIAGMFAFTYKNKTLNPAAWPYEPFTVVVDPGHGGNDPGASAPGGKITEATLSLEIAARMKSLAKEYNVNIVMTRDNDQFPAAAKDKDQALKKRIELVNQANPAAFVSIHLNTTADKSQKKHSGFQAFTSKKRDASSLNLASAVLQSLAGVYKTEGEARIRETEGVYVLDKSNSPSVLLQCGFINNPDDLEFVSQRSNQEKIARSILEGIIKYQTQSSQQDISLLRDVTDSGVATGSNTFISHPEKIILQTDTIVFHSYEKQTKPDLARSLVIINDKKYEPQVLQTTTIISKEVHVYPGGNPEALTLYGKEAAEGVLIFKDARIIEQLPSEYYKNELNTTAGDTDKVFQKVEIEPAFAGGVQAWNKFLDQNMDRSIAVENGAPPGNYTVFIQFIVDRDGNVSEVMPLTRHGYGMEEEAARLIKKGPKWLPGIQHGKKVNAYKKQPFQFRTKGDLQFTTYINTDTIKPNKEVVVTGYPTKKSDPALKEVVVKGYPTKRSDPALKEVVVTGYPTKRSDPALKEVVVTGYPTKKSDPAVKEVVVTGYPTKKSDPALKEVVVKGYPTKKSDPALKEVVVTGYPTKRSDPALKEVVVTGYPTKKSDPALKEVVVTGYPTKRSDPALKEVVVDGRPATKKNISGRW